VVYETTRVTRVDVYAAALLLGVSVDGVSSRAGDSGVARKRCTRGRTVSVAIHPGRLPIQHLRLEVLRRPVEFTQYLSIRYTERLAEAGIAPSVGSVGDSYDNALAESVIGLCKTVSVR
jgi:hypothetical protein